MIAFSTSALIIILSICITIGILPFCKEYKNAKKYAILKAFLIWLAVLFSYINIELTENLVLCYSFGWVLTFVMLIMAVKELLYAAIILKKVRAGKEVASVSSEDIPVSVRIVFEPLANGESQQNCKQSFKENFKKLFPTMLLLIYMLFMFGVYEPYFANIDEWKFDFINLLIPSLIVLAVGIGLTAVISSVLDRYSSDVITIWLSTFALLAYIQSSFLNQKSFLDGTMLDITKEQALFNLILWIVIGSIPVFCYRIWRNSTVKVAVYASLGLLIVQIAPLPFMIINCTSLVKEHEYEAYCLSGEKQFEVSSDENVIVFIMDAYYKGYFDEYIEKNPEATGSLLSDFTYFDNVTTETIHTAFSMPCLLTQHDSDYSISLIDSNAAAWASSEAEDFYGKMQDRGYSVRLYTDNDRYSGDAENMIGKIDNVSKYHCEYITDMIPTYISMLKLSFYRYCPSLMKSFFFVADAIDINRHTKSSNPEDNLDLSNWSEISGSAKDYGICFLNADYYSSLMEGLTAVSDKKICIFQHIYGTHLPVMGIEKNDWEEGVPMEAAINGCMTILEEYMEQLKKIGVYDNSTIIVTADHGVNFDVKRSQPVMLIKPAGVSKEQMTVNTAPGVLQDDLLPTILDCVGMESGSSAGYSLFSLDENMQRERIIRDFRSSSQFKKSRKCTGVGIALFNCYEEYTFLGRVDEQDFDTMEGEMHSITDYWW